MSAIRQLWDLTRYRIDLVGARGAEKNRAENVEDTGIKLSVVASDIFRAGMMAALIAGEIDESRTEGTGNGDSLSRVLVEADSRKDPRHGCS